MNNTKNKWNTFDCLGAKCIRRSIVYGHGLCRRAKLPVDLREMYSRVFILSTYFLAFVIGSRCLWHDINVRSPIRIISVPAYKLYKSKAFVFYQREDVEGVEAKNKRIEKFDLTTRGQTYPLYSLVRIHCIRPPCIVVIYRTTGIV